MTVYILILNVYNFGYLNALVLNLRIYNFDNNIE